MYPSDRRFGQRPSGVPGLDSLLNGGFVDGRLYLVIGPPGSGKTLLGTQFLRAGLDADETVLFIHSEESAPDLRANAANLGIDIDDAEFLDVGPESDFFTESGSYDVVSPGDIEDGYLISDIRREIEAVDPDRILIDPITHFQYLEPTEYQFRKRLISFARFLKDRGTTVLATKTPSEDTDTQLKSLSDGVVVLSHDGEKAGRRIRVPKHRGVGQQDGSHGMEIREHGVEVYPTGVDDPSERQFEPTQFASGITELDALLGGGIERGTVTILSGPAGIGKSTTATQFLANAAANGQPGLACLFEESIETFVHRSETFGLPISRLREEGSLFIEEVGALSLSPEEFAHQVRAKVRDHGIELVVIDGISGYKSAIKGGENDVELRRRLRALIQRLVGANTSVVLIDQRREVTGFPQPTSESVSYLADNIVFENYIEVEGELQRVVGVLKKRVGGFETVPRRFRITADGLEVGDPVSGMHGVFKGIPDRSGAQ
ncbi:ATPase domain-containing protein [Haloarcula laminariae]|uniref:ATPase domain-containing protein n=1 Tax=Haloarcula laminariae TaxID=2961577 RepID=UPI002405CA97|nr:ATPase domain-containing protein [Halomicroarcula sp. FL173]